MSARAQIVVMLTEHGRKRHLAKRVSPAWPYFTLCGIAADAYRTARHGTEIWPDCQICAIRLWQ